MRPSAPVRAPASISDWFPAPLGCLPLATARSLRAAGSISGSRALPRIHRLPPHPGTWDALLGFEILRAGCERSDMGAAATAAGMAEQAITPDREYTRQSALVETAQAARSARPSSAGGAGTPLERSWRLEPRIASAVRCAPRPVRVAEGAGADPPAPCRRDVASCGSTRRSTARPTLCADALRGVRGEGYSSTDRPRLAYQASISDMISLALSAYSNSFRCDSVIMCSLHR